MALLTNEVISILEDEKECVKRNVDREHGVKNCGCDRDCLHCDLLHTEEDIIEAYDIAIGAIYESR